MSKSTKTLLLLGVLILGSVIGLVFFLNPKIEEIDFNKTKGTLERISKKWGVRGYKDISNEFSFDPSEGIKWAREGDKFFIKYGTIEIKFNRRHLLDEEFIRLLKLNKVTFKGDKYLNKEYWEAQGKKVKKEPFKVLFRGKEQVEYDFTQIDSGG